MIPLEKLIKKNNNCVYGYTGSYSVAQHIIIAAVVASICGNAITSCADYIENLDIKCNDDKHAISKCKDFDILNKGIKYINI